MHSENKKAAFHNLGCKVNQYETDAMVQALKERGYEIVPFEKGADVYIINTCTVTNIADRKSRQMLHRAKKMNPSAVGKFSHTGALKDRDGLDNFIRAKFKIISSTNGFAASYKSIDGSKKNFSCDGLKYTLADSVSVCIDNTSSIKQVVSGASGEPEIKEVCSTPKNIHIYVDVNGEKNPNIGGKDMFDFYINEFGEFITSLGEPSCNEMYHSDSFDDNYTFKYLLGIGTACKKNPFGENCTEAIQDNNWKMNY